MKTLLTSILLILALSGFGQKAHVTAYNTAAAANETYLSQGLTWYQYGHASQGTYARVGSISAFALNSSPGNAALPIQSAMRGCLLLDNGKVNYYLSATDWTKKADGVTVSVLTGADGQVMVEIPKFYYKYDGGSNAHTWRISLYPLTGYTVHPAFIKDGVEVNYRYIGAYEAVLYDISGSAYVDGHTHSATPTSATWASGDKLSSVSGKYPITFHTRAEFRVNASNRGSGWRQLDYDLYSAVQLLYLIEYGSFYSQSVLSAGITNCVATWAAYNNYYPIAKSGNGNAIGNSSGANAAAVGSVCADIFFSGFLKYRGIENPYGHIWKFVDGININAGLVYISNTSSSWADDTGTNYTNTGITNSTSSEYQTTLNYTSRGFLPATVGSPGTSSAYITDYYYYAAGWRVMVAGGHAYEAANAGFFDLFAHYGAADADRNVGARLAF